MAGNVRTITPRTAAPAPPPPVAGVSLLGDTGEQVAVVAKFFRALGDPTRLRLLEFLLTTEHTVSECVARIGLSQGRVSAHLACLSDCGYIAARRDGRFCHYRVVDPRVADLIVVARAMAADNASALAACLHIQPCVHGPGA
ncbi:ArsR/SmtB family transcription factor [Sporichthya polymorpha]|uniref:ArsR/SmtB family transcription factor n=1 Tax=Sporichthya polymorpha TaxID=35751 RepID=UPI00039EDA56|nr:metalloregulator ArsR/SmtB family transcription factor [Sporichthya polymorpha]